MKLSHLILFGLTPLFTSFVNGTENSYTKESQALLIKMQQEIKGTLLTISQNELKAGKDINNLSFKTQIPVHHNFHLGLELDTKKPENGYVILSIIPGSIADKLSISVGDTIIAINGKKIGPNYSISEQLQASLKNQKLTFEVKSEGKVRILTTKIDPLYIPQISLEIGTEQALANNSKNAQYDTNACGQVHFAEHIIGSKIIYPVYITKINDKNKRLGSTGYQKDAPYENKIQHNLKTGKNTITLTSPGAQSEALQRRSMRAKKVQKKIFEINIEKNKTYYLAAQVNKIAKTWKPIIYKIENEECELAWHEK